MISTMSRKKDNAPDEQDESGKLVVKSEKEKAGEEIRRNLLPYPASTLSPVIIPNDLTSFKSRGASMVEKELKQRLLELKEQYAAVVDSFNWNKLIYESKFSFEPVMGQSYHLYEVAPGKRRLTMIPAADWPQYLWLGEFRLNVDRRWESVEVSEDFDLRGMAGNEES